MTTDPTRSYRAALPALLILVPAGGALAQGSVGEVSAKGAELAGCYVEKARVLSDELPCQAASAVVDKAIKACAGAEDALLAARKAAEMDADKSIVAGLRDRSRRALADTVFTTRLTAAHCKNE